MQARNSKSSACRVFSELRGNFCFGVREHGLELEFRPRRRGIDVKQVLVETLKDEGSTDFALLFCEPHNVPFYTGRGWKPFDGEIYADQPGGRVRFDAIAPYVHDIRRAPRQGVIDLCGLPW